MSCYNFSIQCRTSSFIISCRVKLYFYNIIRIAKHQILLGAQLSHTSWRAMMTSHKMTMEGAV